MGVVSPKLIGAINQPIAEKVFSKKSSVKNAHVREWKMYTAFETNEANILRDA